MDILISSDEGAIIAMLNGRLDTNSSATAEEKLIESSQNGQASMVIDFAKTDYISSSGLRVLLKLAKNALRNKGALALCNANQQILEVLEISGFLGIVKYFENLKEAVSFVSD